MGGPPAGPESPRWARPRRAGGAAGREGALALALAGAAGAADAQLLASVFLGLQQGLGWPPLVLGALALAEGLAAGVAVPLWQRTLGRGGGAPARALAAGCLAWGLGTALSAGAPSLAAFIVVRALATGALAVLSPAAQAFLPPAEDGALGGACWGDGAGARRTAGTSSARSFQEAVPAPGWPWAKPVGACWAAWWLLFSPEGRAGRRGCGGGRAGGSLSSPWQGWRYPRR